MTLGDDRRKAWFTTSLIGTAGLSLVLAAGIFTAHRATDRPSTMPIGQSLRALTVNDVSLRQKMVFAPPPQVTASVAPQFSFTRPQPITRNAGIPTLRGFLNDDARPRPVTAPADKAAETAVRLAALGAYSRADRPTVIEPDGPAETGLGEAPASRTMLGKRPAPEPIQEHTIVVTPGDTLYEILDQYGVGTSDSVNLIQALTPVFPAQQLRSGQEITLVVRDLGTGQVKPQSLKIAGGNVDASITLDDEGDYVVRGGARPGKQRSHHRALASIRGSLYATARNQDVPDPIIVRMMHTHSYDVDFQREIKLGDTFEVFYSAAETQTESRATPATLLYSSLTTGGKTRSYYRFEGDDGSTDYYDSDGASVKKPLMKTPINGARISSRFGMRKHPILGYTKMHGGADFAAPTGTPVLAAGDGVVDFAGRNGGYGNYVRLSHKEDVKTAYAHMSRIAKGIRPGKRVRQGQIIGFVGSTGRSTGPHLHYEVHVDGKKKDPLTVKVAGGGRRLDGEELARFIAERDRIDELRANAPITTRVAAAKP